MKAIDLGGGLLGQDTQLGTGKYSAVKGATVKILWVKMHGRGSISFYAPLLQLRGYTAGDRQKVR